MLSGRVGLGAKPFVAALHSAEVSSARHRAMPASATSVNFRQKSKTPFRCGTNPLAPGNWYKT